MLTLTTCHPKGNARQRLIVRLELVKTVPTRPGATGDGWRQTVQAASGVARPRSR